jgi:hypothetical protein
VVTFGQAGAPDDPDDDEPSGEEKAVRALEWRIEVARRSAELDRRRRLRAVEVEIAEQELRARRESDRRQHAVRAALARERRTGDVSRSPTVDLAGLDVSQFRITRL